MNDLAIIIVSTNEANWLRPCLSSIFDHAGAVSIDVVVADNESTDGTPDVVGQFPGARVVTCANHGFAHANNRALMTTNSRYVLFLNPDTEILAGSFEQLLSRMDQLSHVGLAGVRQVTADGELFPTIRRFPNAARALAEAFGTERFAWNRLLPGERVLAREPYDQETLCDWTSGSFMLARREALESSGYMDERFFIYSEEPDLCLRMRKAGWRTIHLPAMTILHHAKKAGLNPRIEAQGALARVQYARKHFSLIHRELYRTTLALRHLLRLALASRHPEPRLRRDASKRALLTIYGRSAPPYEPPPDQAVRPRDGFTSGEA